MSGLGPAGAAPLGTRTRSRTIAVVGASGVVGRAVLRCLRATPELNVRATSRRPHADPAGAVDWVAFDWDAPVGLEPVVAGVDALLIVPPAGHHPLPTTTRLLDAAAAAGVGHVVFVSTLGADFEPGFTFGRWALEGEQAMADAGVAHTVLRPNSLMTNFFTTMRPQGDGVLRLPWGAGATSFVDPEDVGAVAARILAAPADHVGATYWLTGPEPLDTATVAAVLRAASDAPVQYVDTPAAAVRATMASRGVPGPMVEAFMELHAVMASGARGVVTDHVRAVLGRPPRRFADVAADHAGVLVSR